MVAIGITGHRIVTEIEKIQAGVEEALHRVEKAFPGQAWTVISALAEGADRLVVQRVLARPYARLVAVLPLPDSDYLADFAAPESGHEFLTLLAQADEVIELPPAPPAMRPMRPQGSMCWTAVRCCWQCGMARGRRAKGARRPSSGKPGSAACPSPGCMPATASAALRSPRLWAPSRAW
jgi:hypothetical protein